MNNISQDELFFMLALQATEGVGDVTAKKLIQQLGSAEAVFKSSKSQLASIDGIGKKLLKNILDKKSLHFAEEEVKFILNNKINVAAYNDENYPSRLKHCFDAPILMFSSGNINLENDKIISIVGTRQITSYGVQFTRQLIEELAPLNPLIVSGFAYGVDIVAHQAAIENKLQTIGVLAHGLNQIYPKVHKKYMKSMEENGGFMTDFWSDTSPDRENFIKRNRIVAGISEATIVIESAEKGGSLITATMAHGYNREVFAVPGRSTDKYSQGCNTLIKTQKAQLLTSAADLIYMLNWDLGVSKSRNNIKAIQKQLFVSLNEEEQKVIDFLQENQKEHMDIIAIQCDLPVSKLSSMMINLELQGMIRPLPGKYFELA